MGIITLINGNAIKEIRWKVNVCIFLLQKAKHEALRPQIHCGPTWYQVVERGDESAASGSG